MDEDALYAAALAGDDDAISKLEMEADRVDPYLGETILHIESGKGNTERVRFILRNFADKNLLVKTSKYKQTALHLAIYRRHTEVAELLIDAARHLPLTSFQSFLRQAGEDRNTALHRAVMEGHASIVKLLVEADPSDTHIQNYEGKTPMYIAVEKGLHDIVEIISMTCTAPSLDGPDGSTVVPIKNIDQVKSPGGTLYKIMDRDALYAAAFYGDADAIATLEMQADKVYAYDRTILHIESEKGNIERVRFILRKFADKNLLAKSNEFKQTALHLAAYDGHTEVAEVLIEEARHLSVTSFQAFLRQGDQDKDTALHAAVKKGHVDIAKLLVEADPSERHSQNKRGETPMYIAAERGYFDMVKMICTTCTAPINLDGPGGSTALHAAIKNLEKAKEEDRNVIRIIINAVKNAGEKKGKHADKSFLELFNKTGEDRCTILELSVEQNHVDVVQLILAENPAYQDRIERDLIGLMPLIYKANDKEYREIVKLLAECYAKGTAISSFHGDQVASLILAIRKRDTESVNSLLDNIYAKDLVTFADNLGWTALHHAAYHKFDSIIQAIVKVSGHKFVYEDMISTPFHVAAKKGHTSTMILLMELWPSSFTSAFTALDKNGQTILHIAALQSEKEMIEGILKYCPKDKKKKFVNEQDNNGNTPLHLLISRGCFVPQLLRCEGLDMGVENKEKWTPPEMLYLEDQIIDNQVQIKIALDHIQINQQRDFFSSPVLPSKRMRKDVIFNKQAEQMMSEKYARMKEDTDAIANCFADAIAGDPISKGALEMKADTLNESGETILHVESKKGVMENVRFIVKEFANKSLLRKLDRSKQTALHLAVLNGKMDIVKVLVEADPSDKHTQNNQGKTPIYIAAEKGYTDIMKVLCTTCTALSLDGPGGRTTALHALIQNISQGGASDVIRMMVNAAKNASLVDFEELFRRTDESGSTVLQLAVERNYVDAVRLILQEDPAYQPGREIKRNGLMRLIFKAMDKKYSEAIDRECSDDIIKLLSETYKAGIVDPVHKDRVLALILAIKKRDADSVFRHLKDAKNLVSFKEDNGWTPLHYAVYHEFDSVLGAIIDAQQQVGHLFVYENRVLTPFHVAVKHGYTSTVKRLMQSWPTPSSAVNAANCPYTVVDEIGRNILHLAAADNKKEMVEDILKYCPKMYRDIILKQQDNNGDTPLHLLISHGCFIRELIKHKVLDTMPRNNNNYTPQDMLYFQFDVVADQAQIKIALDDMQTGNFFLGSKKKNISESLVIPSTRAIKDKMFNEHKNSLMDTQMEKGLGIYRKGIESQIVVSALITTITFTVGFTMPGGLHQSGEVDEGMVVLSKKAAFKAFMVLDALALLLSACSMFIYFFGTLYEDPYEVFSIHATTTVLNMVSVTLMMLVFITGTYVVLSQSPALAITVCAIGSLFFLFVIVQLMKFVCVRRVKKSKD